MADPPPHFAAQVQNGVNAKAYRLLVGQTLSPIEADVGSSNMETSDLRYNARPVNALVKFGDDVFMWQKDVIWKLNLGTNSWDSEFTVSGQNTNRHGGLYHIDINGVPSLIGFYGAGLSWISYDESSGWVNQGQITGTDHIYGWQPIAVFRGVCFQCRGGNSQRMWWYDPSNDVFTVDASATAIGDFAAYAALGGRLYQLVYRTNTLNEVYLKYWTGTGFSNIAAVGNYTHAEPIKHKTIIGNYINGELIAWNGSLYAFFAGGLAADTYTGWWFFKLTPSSPGALITASDEVDLTDPVIPSNYRAGSSNRSIGYTNVVAVADYDTDPVSPDLYWFVARNVNTEGWSYWRWNGEASPMTVVGSLGSYGLALSKLADGGGVRFWTAGSLNVMMTGMETGTGGLKLSFQAYGDSGYSDKTVKFYYSTDEAPPLSQCTLIGSATGGSAVRNGNQVDDVDADDGVTEYSIVWDFATDGGYIGGRANVKARIQV